MRILVVGAGATGGYFGGRMMEAGLDVTFLVRPNRQAQLIQNGLKIFSPAGDLHLQVPTVLANAINDPWDLVILSCKAYDLQDAIASMAPAVGSASLILPLLNGMRHLDQLDEKFGAQRVLGGLCAIATTLNADGSVRHMSDFHALAFGARQAPQQDRVDRLAGLMQEVRVQWRASPDILQEMWEKWVFLASLAAGTCLFRGAIGDIMLAGGHDVMTGLLAEAQSVAALSGHAARPEVLERHRAQLTGEKSTLSASMMRDLERGGAIEADHVIGDLLARGAALPLPLFRLARCHLETYQNRRQREQHGN